MSLPLHSWRALHSYAVEAAFACDDDELRDFLLADRIGGTLEQFSDHLLAGDLSMAILVGEAGVFVRLLTAGDDGPVGLTHPRACDLGVDENELAVLVRAEAAARGVEPDQIAWPVRDDGNLA